MPCHVVVEAKPQACAPRYPRLCQAPVAVHDLEIDPRIRLVRIRFNVHVKHDAPGETRLNGPVNRHVCFPGHPTLEPRSGITFPHVPTLAEPDGSRSEDVGVE